MELTRRSSPSAAWRPLASSHGKEKAPASAEHSLAGSRFEWERLNPTGFPGNVRLDKVRQRYFLLSTSSNPVQMFNPGVLEQRPGSRSRR